MFAFGVILGCFVGWGIKFLVSHSRCHACHVFTPNVRTAQFPAMQDVPVLLCSKCLVESIHTPTKLPLVWHKVAMSAKEEVRLLKEIEKDSR